MKKSWTSTKLIAVASLAVLNVIIALLSSAINMATGVTMAGGVLTSFTGPLLLIVCLLVVNRFGSASLFLLVTSVLALPLNYAGPPGFLPKVLVYLVAGLMLDLLYISLRRYSRFFTCLLIGGVEDVYVAFAVFGVGRLFGVPGIDRIATFVPLPVFIIVVFLMGAIGGYLGWLIYHKIKNTAVVKRIQQ